jgi:hypothetical protein
MARPIWQLRRSELRILAVVVSWQAAIAILLRLIPLQTVRKGLLPFRRITAWFAGSDERRVIWALEATAPRLPRLWSSCLTRALLAELLLADATGSVLVTIGIRRDRSALEAHAWVERDGCVILGNSQISDQVTDTTDFVRLMTLQPAVRPSEHGSA